MQKIIVKSYDGEFEMIIRDEHNTIRECGLMWYASLARNRDGKRVAAHAELEKVVHPECNRTNPWR